MYHFGEKSKRELATCCAEINVVANEAIKIFDFAVTEGRRSKAQQNRMYDIGKSHLRWPHSAHNVEVEDDLSDAFDFVPHPVDWNDREQFTLYAGVFVGIAHAKGIRLLWGGDWDNDFDVKDNSFDDLVHLQVIR